MKFVLTGDWHLRAQRPQSRLDADYFATQRGKVRQVLELARECGAEAVLQPGDFFDSVDVPLWVIKSYIDLLGECGVRVLCVRGQHDLRYHSRNVDNTPLAVMESAGVVRVVKEEGFWKDKLDVTPEVKLFGLSWGNMEELGEEIRGAPSIQILILHKMVVTEKLWFGQEDFIYAGHLFREYPEVDLFVCGDNHRSFAVQGDARRGRAGRHVVNCGSLMRSGIDQVGHCPVAYVYDTDTRALHPHFLDVAPAEEVLDVERAREADARDAELKAFVDGLRAERDLGLGFLENLRAAVAGVDAGVRGVVEEALGRVVK